MAGSWVAYREARIPGGGTPVVLVHGLGMSSRSFRDVMALLSTDHHVIALDLPGCGDSPRHDEALGVDQLVAVLREWLDVLGIERADLVGHSLGGQVVGRLARRHPERVRRLVLLAASPDPSAPRIWHKAARLAKDAVREPWPVVRYAIGAYLRAHKILAAQTLEDALQADPRRNAPQIGAPTLVVQGDRDPVVTLAWSRELAALIPDGRLAVIPGGTHAVPAQSPRELAELLRDFLADSGD